MNSKRVLSTALLVVVAIVCFLLYSSSSSSSLSSSSSASSSIIVLDRKELLQRILTVNNDEETTLVNLVEPIRDALRDNAECHRSAAKHQPSLLLAHPRHTHGLCIVNDDAKLLYIMVPKASSMTNFNVMHVFYNQSELRTCNGADLQLGGRYADYFRFSMIVDIGHRFLSSWLEIHDRMNRDESSCRRYINHTQVSFCQHAHEDERRILSFVDDFINIEPPFDEHLMPQLHFLIQRNTAKDNNQQLNLFDLDFVGRAEQVEEFWMRTMAATLSAATRAARHIDAATTASLSHRSNINTISSSSASSSNRLRRRPHESIDLTNELIARVCEDSAFNVDVKCLRLPCSHPSELSDL